MHYHGNRQMLLLLCALLLMLLWLLMFTTINWVSISCPILRLSQHPWSSYYFLSHSTSSTTTWPGLSKSLIIIFIIGAMRATHDFKNWVCCCELERTGHLIPPYPHACIAKLITFHSLLYQIIYLPLYSWLTNA